MTSNNDQFGMSAEVLIDLLDQNDEVWGTADLKEILTHLWASSVVDEFAQFNAASARQTGSTVAADGIDPALSFEDVITSPNPSIDALQNIKLFAKYLLADGGELPEDVARIIYVVTILAGRAAGYHEISRLTGAEIKRETARCLTFGWLPDSVRMSIRSLAAPLE